MCGNSQTRQPQEFSSIPLPLPRERILKRLGWNRHHTAIQAHQLTVIEQAMHAGFGLCQLRARALRIPIAARTEETVTLEDGSTFTSKSFCRLIETSHEVMLLAATVGQPILDAINDAFARENATWAAVLDATASETVDAVLGWVQDYLRQQLRRQGLGTTMRYSPGYGDLGLENQKTAFHRLRLDDWGLRLTERYLLVPEKSVIGLTGLGPVGMVEPTASA